MKDFRRLIAQFILIGLLFTVAVGCNDKNEAMRQDLEKMQLDLDTRIQKLKQIEKRVTQLDLVDLVEKGDFLHEVYFNFKKDISEKDKANFLAILSELKNIPEAKGTQIGIPKDTGDKRIRSDYDMVLHMSFNNLADYQTYQNHETHLSVKKRIGSMLSAPPFVYDFEIK